MLSWSLSVKQEKKHPIFNNHVPKDVPLLNADKIVFLFQILADFLFRMLIFVNTNLLIP